jgi:hypothetical protein
VGLKLCADDDTVVDTTRRSSAGSIASSAPIASPLPTSHRTDLFHSLRPMASTESMNMALGSKRTFFSVRVLPCALARRLCRNPIAFYLFWAACIEGSTVLSSRFAPLHVLSSLFLVQIVDVSLLTILQHAQRALEAPRDAAAPAASQLTTATRTAKRTTGRRIARRASRLRRRTLRL